MITLVLPSSGGDVAPLQAVCEALAPTTILHPGALRNGHGPRHPGLAAASLVGKLWSRGDAERTIRAEFVQRALLDRYAARHIRRTRPRLVIAPSLAARYTLAAARAVGARAVLMLDLPLLRRLARDLDRAANAWPERRFLRRVRPSSAAIATQEAELVLAELTLVRGPYAHDACLSLGGRERSLAWLPRSARAMLPATSPTGRVRLAGLATARHGLDIAREVVAARGLTLVVRVGEGTEPSDLATKPGIATDDGPVDVVLAPALCEAYPAEVLAAQHAGIPVVCSSQSRLVGTSGVDPFNAEAVGEALDVALAGRGPIITSPDTTDLLEKLSALLAAK